VPALSFEQACLCDYLRVINDLLRPRRGGRALQKDFARFIALLQQEMPALHSAAWYARMQSCFPNIIQAREVGRTLEALSASSPKCNP
jgi:hypothetical protein